MQTAQLEGIRTPADVTLGTQDTFGIGDVVAIREGGPRMTVTYVGPVALNPGNWLICEWFDEHGELRREMFSPGSVRAEPRSIPAGSVMWSRDGRAA